MNTECGKFGQEIEAWACFPLPDALDAPCLLYSFIPGAGQVQLGTKHSPSNTRALSQQRPSSRRAAAHKEGQSTV